MLFNSLEFAVFFPIVTAVYFLLPLRGRIWWLLLASCYFYMALIPAYIVILAFTICIDFAAGILIDRASGASRKRWLIVSLIANIGMLAVFKYYNFFAGNINAVAGDSFQLQLWKHALPVGLSFHTFQSMSYTIEVYRKRQSSVHDFVLFALYVMFYPQLVAGPIERPQNLLHQFGIKHEFDYVRVTDGLKQMAWGLFKKVVIADRVAQLVNPIYNAPQNYNGFELFVATFLFAIQIYCDFSGYSEVALGSAKVMGFTLMQNFRRPYFARSIAEFWSRWHISLSTWFRDYLYIPLGGNRVSRWRWQLNLMIVFLVSGFWHGANWTFILWGALHGAYSILAIWLAPLTNAIKAKASQNTLGKWLITLISVLVTFALVCIAWVFFRANTASDAFYILTHMLDWSKTTLRQELSILPLSASMLIAILLLIEFAQERLGNLIGRIALQPASVRWAIYTVGVLSILFLGEFENAGEFIYFQF